MAYIGNAPGQSTQRITTTFTATQGQTSFNPVSGYTPGYADVYLNGVKLIDTNDYTATNGVTVVLNQGATLDDVVEVLAYVPRGLTDGYTKIEADARYATEAQGALADSAVQPDDDIALGDLTVDQATLKAIAETKADTAVDVFVYDTRKDSDGGAWRKRTQHTSWYNETLNTATRGSRREFPAVAILVHTGSTIKIYDGDDPTMPLWGHYSNLTQDSGFAASVTARDGSIFGSQRATSEVYSGNGWYQLNFVADYFFSNIIGIFASWRQGRHDNLLTTNTYTVLGDRTTPLYATNLAVNDLAVTVLPNAPIDSATGLPTPTIALATHGGVSVIKDDGSVVDITHTVSTYTGAKDISFNGNQISYASQQSGVSTNYWRKVFIDIPSSDVTGAYTNNIPGVTIYDARGSNSIGNVVLNTNADLGVAANNIQGAVHDKAVGFSDKLTFLDVDYFPGDGSGSSDKNSSMVAYVTSDYNTGWMNGDIKLATLSDTDLVDAGSSYDPSGITYRDSGRITSHTYVTGATTWQVVDDTSNSTAGYFGLTIPTVEGVTYTIYHTMDQTPPATQRHHVQHVDGDNSVDYFGDVGQLSDSITFIAQGAETRFVVYNANDVTTTHTINIVYGVPNRTISGVSDNTHLEPYGIVTKTPVATGADLVAYSGFSGTNYLMQPNNSGLDIGTEDFSVIYWVNVSDLSGTQIYWSIANPVVNNNRTAVYTLSNGDTRFFLRQNNTEDIYGTGAGGVSTNKWTHIAAVRSGNMLLLYINGELKASGATTKSIAQTDKELKIGVDWDVASAGAPGSSMALFRYSATAPTAKQIEKIYNDEKVLFQENSKATLYGTSDAVTALAYDEDTDILHAGTSQGRSDFQGLRRINNTTDAVGAAISASNGMIVEE